MLTAKFVAREPSASQHSPQSSLRPGRFLPQTSGAFNVLLGRNRRTPHPDPLPIGWGEGGSFAAPAFCFAARFGNACRFLCRLARHLLLPSSGRSPLIPPPLNHHH